MANYKTIDFINNNFDIHDVYRHCLGRPLGDAKIVCPNPEHRHVNNTPSAKCYGNKIKCFGACQRTFGCYDLLKWYDPDKINEVRSTYLYSKGESVSKQGTHPKMIVPIDRTQPISQIIKTILEYGDTSL